MAVTLVVYVFATAETILPVYMDNYKLKVRILQEQNTVCD